MLVRMIIRVITVTSNEKHIVSLLNNNDYDDDVDNYNDNNNDNRNDNLSDYN